MVWKRYCLLGKRRWPRRVCFEWSWSDMAGICVKKWPLQLEFRSIRGRNFGCNTSCAKNGRKIADTTWFEQTKRSSLAWSYIIRYVATIRDPHTARVAADLFSLVLVRSEILKSHDITVLGPMKEILHQLAPSVTLFPGYFWLTNFALTIFKRWQIRQMRAEFCQAHGMENGKTMMEILSMDALDHHPGLAQPRLQNLYLKLYFSWGPFGPVTIWFLILISENY